MKVAKHAFDVQVAKHGLARTQDSSYAAAPLTATALQLTANLDLPDWDQAFPLDAPTGSAFNRASPATAVRDFPNTLLDTVLEDQVWEDPLQHFAGSSADSDLFAAVMPQSMSTASAASAVRDSNAVRNSASNSSSWDRHAAVQQTQQPAADSSQHGFEDVDLWGTLEPSSASGEVAAAALAVSGDKAPDNEQLSVPHAERLFNPAVATTHLSPVPHRHAFSKVACLRQNALQQAHITRHVGIGQRNSTFGPSSRTSSSSKGAASLQGEKAVQSSSLAGGLADWDGTFQAWESRGGGIKAVKLHQGSIVSTDGTQTGSRPLPPHLEQDAADHALMLQQDVASSPEGIQIGSRQLVLPLDQDATNSPDGVVRSADLDGFPSAVAQPTDAQTDKWGLAPFSGYSAQLWQKASNAAMEQFTAAKQAVQEHSVSTGAISLQDRGTKLARTISDKARPEQCGCKDRCGGEQHSRKGLCCG